MTNNSSKELNDRIEELKWTLQGVIYALSSGQTPDIETLRMMLKKSNK